MMMILMDFIVSRLGSLQDEVVGYRCMCLKVSGDEFSFLACKE